MKGKWQRSGLAVLAAVAALVIFSSVAMAQGKGPGAAAVPGQGQAQRLGRGEGGMGPGYGLAVRGAWGGRENSLVAVAAETLGMEQQDLAAELQGDKTLADVAEAQGVEVQAIVDAFMANRQEVVAQAVTDGKITQVEADAMLSRMQAMITSRLSQDWQPRGNGDCDGTCDGSQNRQMQRGRRQG